MRSYLVSILKLLNKFKYFMNGFCFNLSELARGFGVSNSMLNIILDIIEFKINLNNLKLN